MRRWPAATRCATAVAAMPRSSGATAGTRQPSAGTPSTSTTGVLAERRRPRHLLVGHAREQDPVDAVVEERAELLRLEAGVALGVDDHQHHAPLPRRVLRALHDAAGERGRGDAVAHESDHAGALQPQPARDAVRACSRGRRPHG